MCQFFSGVITKNKTIVDYDDDSHEHLLEKGGLRDNSRDPDFVRVELIPQDKDIWNHNIKNWKLKVDQDFRPDWFEEKWAEQEMRNEIKKLWEERFIINRTVKEIKEGRWWLGEGGTIKNVSGGTIEDVSGGTIKNVSGGTIKNVSGGTIENVSGGTIKNVSGGTIENVSGDGIVIYRNKKIIVVGKERYKIEVFKKL